MDFADAASNVAGAFALHVEARHGRWGILSDVNFLRLSSDVNYTTPILGAPIAGTVKLDQVIFNGQVMYAVKSGMKFMLVGGIRTFSMSPSAHFTGPVGGQLADINAAKRWRPASAALSTVRSLRRTWCFSRKLTSAAVRPSRGAHSEGSSFKSSRGSGWPPATARSTSIPGTCPRVATRR
jgi:hypothetical protein